MKAFKIKSIRIWLFTLIIIGNISEARIFRFGFKEGEYKITSFSRQEIYLNNRYITTKELKNKAVFHVKPATNSLMFFDGMYFYYDRDIDKNEVFNLKEVYTSRFFRDRRGKYYKDKDYFMPVVRNLPVFPDRDIKVGDRFEEVGYEVQDFRANGIARPYIMPFKAFYHYIGDVNIDNKRCAKFLIHYTINRSYPKRLGYRNPYAPAKVLGIVELTLYFDLDENIPYKYEERYNFIKLSFNNQIIEYKGSGNGILERVIYRADKIESELKDKVKRIDKGIKIERRKEGVAINIGEILFEFDSDRLKPTAITKLDKIINLLKKYKDHEIIIEGHTDNIGSEAYNKKLSIRRAMRICEFLRQKGFDTKKLSYKGYGSKKPKYPNTTREGRAKNRRVEIIIAK